MSEFSKPHSTKSPQTDNARANNLFSNMGKITKEIFQIINQAPAKGK
jgi:hypothetical protein